MRTIARRLGILVVGLMILGITVTATPVGAGHRDDPRTKNLHPLGHIEEPRSTTALFNPEAPGDPRIHTDIAFWGQTAFQGNWLGFSIRDIRAPGNPRPVSFTECTGGQGDLVVWEHILVRTWDAGAAPGTGAPEGATCAGEDVPEDFAGLHIFDVSDPTAPVLIGSVDLGPSAPEGAGRSCGSHTATGVPDLDNNRLLIYGNPSTDECPWIDIVEIPLDAPQDAAFVRHVEAGRPCHDTGVILGDAMLAACAGGNGFTVLTLDPAEGASLDDPQVLLSKDVNEVVTDGGEIDTGHSAAFSWDGGVLIFGHEPGGGTEARCTADDPASERSTFFFEPRTGEFLGMWTLTRTQTAQENCSIHNYNVVPLPSGRDVMVHGSYQSGTSVVDFTDPANPVEIAWSDPPPLPVPEDPIFCLPEGCELGGAWSSYWYNNLIYETNITEGLNIFRLSSKTTAGALRLGHLNPQTQEFTIP
jgi:hypothetical protein